MNNKLVIGLAPFQNSNHPTVLDAYAFSVPLDKPEIEFMTYDKDISFQRIDGKLPYEFSNPIVQLEYREIVHVDEAAHFRNFRYVDVGSGIFYRKKELGVLDAGTYYNPFSSDKEDRMWTRKHRRRALNFTLAVPVVGIATGVLTASPMIGLVGGTIAGVAVEYGRRTRTERLEKELAQLNNYLQTIETLWDNVSKAELKVTYRQDIADLVKDARSRQLDIPAWIQIENKVANMYGYDKFMKGNYD